MADDHDRIFVAIGVSKPDGNLEPLPGALTAAKRMAEWAKNQGYGTICLLDEGGVQVTIDLLRDKMQKAITEVTDRTTLRRLVVFFAGHGAAQAVGDQYWMLSNWHRRSTEAVKVSALQRMLEFYGPQQVAIIGDACQEYSARFVDVIGSAVLDRSDENPRQFELDQFFAVDVGKQAFMVKAADGHEAFCIFTEVLLDALEGDASEHAFEQAGERRVVTSQSLAVHLQRAVVVEAGRHGVRMIPRPLPGFFTDREYTSILVASDAPASPAPNPSAPDFGALPPSELPSASSPPIASDRGSGGRGLRLLRRFEPKLSPGSQRRLTEAEQRLTKERAARLESFRTDVGRTDVRGSFETGAGLCVSGAEVVGVEASFGDVTRLPENPNWFRFDLGSHDPMRWSDVLVTLEDGRLCNVCVVQSFISALHFLSDGVSVSLVHRRIGSPNDEGKMAIEILAALHAGTARPEQIIDMATMLRDGKHRVITMGCIAAQLYDSIRDVDSLRQMASYYAQSTQPVPLDIVLYGGGTIFEEESCLYARIPAVPPREPRTDIERARPFTTSATQGLDRHPIAGRVPWMRQAWSAIATAHCDESAEDWRRDALDAMSHLRPGEFTTFAPDGRDAACRLVGGHLRFDHTPASAPPNF